VSDAVFAALDLPERFAVETRAADGTWWTRSVHDALDVARAADGAYVLGPGMVLRVVGVHDDLVAIATDDGRVDYVRVVPVP
jgi:hypothetical protein